MLLRLMVLSISLFLFLVVTPARAVADSRDEYTFGIVPQQSAHDLVRLWTPLLRYLSQKSGVQLKFETAPNIPEFERRLERGEYDFAYMNPYHYVVYHEYAGYRAFAHQANKQLVGLIVSKAGSHMRNLEALEGQDIAFPAPAAFAATVIPRAELNNKGISYTPSFVRSHDSVYRNVARGFMVAGGGIERTLATLEPEIRAELEIIWRSKGFTPHAFAANPRVPESVIQRVKQGLFDMHLSKSGREVLEMIRFDGVVAAEDRDWDDIRALRLNMLQPDKQDQD